MQLLVLRDVMPTCALAQLGLTEGVLALRAHVDGLRRAPRDTAGDSSGAHPLRRAHVPIRAVLRAAAEERPGAGREGDPERFERGDRVEEDVRRMLRAAREVDEDVDSAVRLRVALDPRLLVAGDEEVARVGVVPPEGGVVGPLLGGL